MRVLNEKLEVFGSPIPRDRSLYFNYIDYKAASFRSTEDEASFEFKARSVFDPKLRRYRCPPGTQHGGRITNRMGVGCGGNIVRRAIGAVRRLGRATDLPNAPGSRRATQASRVARQARRTGQRAGRGVRGAAGRAGEAYQASGRVQAASNLLTEHPYLRDATRRGRLGELNGFGKALARLAERVDVDDAELTDIAARTGIPKEDLTPERRERLGRMGEGINRLLNQWADRIDVDLEDVTNLPDRTQGNVGEANRLRRNRRERRGIARRERQINRRRRLDQLAGRVDVPEDGEQLTDIAERAYDDYLTTGGRLRNPDRRRINTSFLQAIKPENLNDRKRERLLEAARAEYHNLDDFWGRRLGRRDFTLNDINRHIRQHEKDPVDEATPDGLKALRDDWAELRPFFDPLDGEFGRSLEGADTDEIVGALARLDPDRKERLLEAADLSRTEAISDIGRAANAIERGALADIKKEADIISGWEKKLRAGRFDENDRQNLLALHGDLAAREDRLQRVTDQAKKELDDFDARGVDDPRERAKLVARYRLNQLKLSGVQGNRKNLTDLRAKHPELDRQINKAGPDRIPARIEDVGPEGTFLLGAPQPLPEFAGSLGRIDENGLPEIKLIENPNIKSKEDAIAHVKNGGSLNEVPNEFWFDALEGNASSDAKATGAKFVAIRPMQGAMGNTTIYIAKDENGVPTNRGWVVKAQYDGANINEYMGWVVAEMAGFGGGMPGWDGRGEGLEGRQNLILPMAHNIAPEGEIVKDVAGIFDLGQLAALDDVGAPARVANAMVAFLAAARDRKDANAYSFVVGDKGYALPLDYGLAFHPDMGRFDFPDYVAKYLGEDYDLAPHVNDHLANLAKDDKAKALEQAEAIVDMYDKVLANARRMRKMEPEEWRDRIKKGHHWLNGDKDDPRNNEVIEQGHRMALNQLEQLEKARDEFLKKIIPADLHKEIRDNRIDEANRVTNAADRQSKWAGNVLIPDNEVSVDFSIDTPRKAGEHLKNGGDIGVLPDQVYVHGILQAGDLKDARGQAVDIDAFLSADVLPEQMRNDRFDFVRIKRRQGGYPVWDVYEVQDKQTGKVYYLKAGTYGHTEALNEAIGAEGVRLLGFDFGEENGIARVGPEFERKGYSFRWVVVPHVADYNEVEKNRNAWVDLHRQTPGNLQGKINDLDLARFAVMDYLFNNQDRHQGNVKVARVGGEYRLAPIDQGLIGLARRDGNMGHGGDFSAAARLFADISPGEYRRDAFNNPFRRWMGHVITGRQREEVLRRIQAIVKQIGKVDIDELFDPERLGRKGVDWNPTELQHLEAMKQIFSARLTRLKQDARAMAEAL